MHRDGGRLYDANGAGNLEGFGQHLSLVYPWRLQGAGSAPNPPAAKSSGDEECQHGQGSGAPQENGQEGRIQPPNPRGDGGIRGALRG